MKRIALFLSTLVLVTLACGRASEATPNPPGVPSKTPRASTSTGAIPSLPPTDTPEALPAPILLTGTGNEVVSIKKWSGPAVLKAIYNGRGNFIVENHDASNAAIDLLVNTIGAYSGTVPLDFFYDEQTTSFDVTASGHWELLITSLQRSRHEHIPATIAGIGDEVITFTDATPALLKINSSGIRRNMLEHKFILWGDGASEPDILVNEEAPYTGAVTAGPSALTVFINTAGPWEIEVTAK